MKTIPLDQVIDEQIGKKGTKERSLFDAQVEFGRLGKKIREQRKLRGLSKKELAYLAEIPKSQVKEIEKEILNVKIGILLKVLNVLDIESKLTK